MKSTPLVHAVLGAGLLVMGAGSAHAEFTPNKPECIAPAKPGGGFDLTCRILTSSLDKSGLLKEPMRVTFMPGGVGAVAYTHMNSNRRTDDNAVVAFSSGSSLNLALSKFGKDLDVDDARWIGAVGTDYGAIIVKADAPWNSLQELADEIKSNPSLVFGAGGTVGSQDWMKAAFLYRSLGLDPRTMRYVAYEGGGDALAAVLGNHIQVYPGDVSEIKGQLDAGIVRVLAVLSPERLEGDFAAIPTATEQGFDMEWPIMRGFYMAPEASDDAYNYWVEQFNDLYQTDAFTQVRNNQGLFPLSMAGDEFEAYIKAEVEKFQNLSREMGLLK
ncbi:Bug family tripartite tricarboxylate transporter substrate binding protein [Oceanisphaera psychrotolerans]|uniref:Tricarboxylic transporter n=1 Tax=Oceanisphaera psychrotolerans TaxID=1414654 RepID=A0A1J4Q8S9_9GAMM|nr:tripartite tricarboxylate transporter substrate-binding protein [Oceanisphaera psychrotolerans]OIN03761.1 tricarboxylic transporter [Oceanisphaera psychrotolerans]